MAFDRTESGKFAQVADQVAGKLTEGVEKVLAENAGRGFPAPTGVTLEAVLVAGQEAKGQLVEANAKIYDERRGVIFQQEEFALKILVRVATLAMEIYREEILNALALEQSEAQAVTERARADIARQNSETELRQRAIIRARAEAERRIIVYRQQLVDAEEETLPAEEALVNAQLATAERKLAIIDSIYQILAAEQLVLAAEQRRAASLTKLLTAQEELAAIKQEMVPYYIEKAEAREELADAVTKQIPVLKAIEELGYDRIALKDAEEEATHQERQANLEFEIAKEAYTRASTATQLARFQASRLLQEYANQVRARIMEAQKSLEEDNIVFKLSTSLARQAIGVNNDIAVTNHERMNLLAELTSILNNLEARAIDQAETIRDGAVQISSSTRNVLSSRAIREGIIVGSTGGGATFG